MTTEPQVETLSFQAETRRLLDLVIHSLYTQKEIFLRELISNASDAIDRLRFEALTDSSLAEPGWEPEIRLSADAGARTLSIADNGIGMSREEVVEHIGSIAKSGTRELAEKLKGQPGAALETIGAFGVGFYSAFMVAGRVTLETRRAGGGEAVRWESVADGTYTVGPGERRGHGTTVTLHLKPVDAEAGIEDYTAEHELERIVERYSDFIAYPIRQTVRREKRSADEKGVVLPDGATTIVSEEKTLNSQTPIWARAESEVPEEDYDGFYKQLTGDWDKPLLRLTMKAEGASEYRALLYVPAEAPHDLFLYGAPYGPRLYARRVMVMERCEDLLPRYLRFLRGVVDAADLPLNVSRQMLQENRHVGQIRKWLTRKVLDALAKLQRDDDAKYRAFWSRFGRAIKEGVTFEFDLKDRIVPLLLFESSAKGPGELTTLASYVEGMPAGQKDIYYLTAESRALADNSPAIEAIRAKGWETLYFLDPIDEIVAQYLPEFQGKRLKSAAKGEFEDSRQDESSDAARRFEGLLGTLTKRLDEHVKQARISSRLTESPACLTLDEHDLSPALERMMRAGGGEGPKQKRILELNANHPIVERLQERYEKDASDPTIGDYAELLYGYAALAEGSELPDTVRFNRLLAELLARGL